MAAKTGITPVRWGNCDVFTDINPEKHEELQKLMEKLQNRNRVESLKAARLNVSNEKRPIEAVERVKIRSCLDKLHSAIKVVSQQTLLERLESITRNLGLMFTLPTPTDKNAYISGEMFKLEIVIDPGGTVRDVKISHQGDPVSCEDVIEVLSQGKFDEFTSHVQGLIDIYKIPGDKKQRSKAFLALQSLETDLNGLAQLQSSIKGVANCIHKSPLGILLPRKGGCPMKLIYFVSPYDLLNEKTKSPHPMTVEAITEHGLGHSVTVCLEQYPPTRRLQTIPLMNVVHQDGKRLLSSSLPCFQGLTQLNSAVLPACFALSLPHPVPVALSVVQSIQAVTEINIITEGEPDTLLNLILNQTSKGKISPGSEFFVTLPDQQHAYYLKDGSGNSLDQQAVMVSRIPFTHPTSVAQVLNHLRQQVLFNTVVGSCIRLYAKQDLANSVIFELVATSLQHFTVTFEHPLQDTMVTAELDLSDLINVKFKVCVGEDDETICSDDAASKVFQRCLSIPVTLRSVIFQVSEKLRKEPLPEPVESVPFPVWNRSSFWRSEGSMLHFSHHNPFDVLGRPVVAPENGFGNTIPHAPLKGHLNMASYPLTSPVGNMLPPEPPPPLDQQDKPMSNPLLANLLDQENSPDPEPNPVAESPMLSKLLEDAPISANSAANLASSIPTPPTQKAHRGRPPKRRSQSEAGKGKSPKHRMTELGGSLDSDSVNSFDSDIQCQGSLSDLRHQHLSGQSTSSTVIDLTGVDHITESPMRKLENTFENFIPNDPRHHHDSDVAMLSDVRGDIDRAKDIEIHPNYHPHSNALPKNEEKSTSLEELLKGSGEVPKTKDLSSQLHHINCVNNKETDSQVLNSLRKQTSNQNAQLQRQLSVESSDSCKSSGLSRSASFPQGYTSDSDTLEKEGLNSSKSCDTDSFDLIGSKVAANTLGPSSNTEHKNMKYESKSDGQDLRSLLIAGKKDKQENNIIDKDTKEGKLKMTLPNMVFRPFDRSSSNSSEILDITVGKKSSAKTFDFNSDDDEEPFHGSMSVISAPTMRLSISSKPKNSKLCYSKYPEKVKRKESKMNESGKRKRDKTDKPVKSRKKKKLCEDNGSSSLEVYCATPVESEDKKSTKLKIIKSSLGVSMENSPKPSNQEREKGDGVRKLSKDHSDKYGSSENVNSGKSKSSSQKCMTKNSHSRSLSASSITVSKADSKLMNKTPTIKLKPIAIPTSSSVGVGMAKTPPASSPTQAKAGALTPTSTTIGRIGAVSLATSGSSKSVTGPPSGGKSTMSVSNKTPPSLSKGSSIHSGSKNSISSTSGKQSSSVERKLSQSGRSSTTGNSKGSNGSGKYINDRKGGSPLLTGNRNTPNSSSSSSKSLNSSSKGQSSTSSGFGSKNPATNSLSAASVLSFLNTNESGIASLPRIPKISSASLLNSGAKTSVSSASTTTVTTASFTSSGSGKTNSYNQQIGGNNRVNHVGTTSGSVTNMTSKSPIHGNTSGSSKSPVIGSAQVINKQLAGNFNSPVNKQSPNANISASRSSPVANASNLAKQNIGNQNSVNLKPYTGTSANSSGNRPSVGVTSSAPGSFSAKNSNGSGSSASVNRPVNPKTQHLHNSYTKNTPATNSPTGGRMTSSSVSASTSASNSPVHNDAPKRASNQIVSPPTTSSGGSAGSNKMRPRKSSLSEIVNKLTTAKSTVNSFSVTQEEMRGKFEGENCVEEGDIQDMDGTLSNSNEKGSDKNEPTSPKDLSKSSDVDKVGNNISSTAIKQRSDSIESDVKSVSKNFSANPDNSCRKNNLDSVNLDKIPNKENESEDNSRNLFASIMKSAYEGFSCSDGDKNDKENVSRVYQGSDRDNSSKLCDNSVSQTTITSKDGNPNSSKKNQSPKPSPKFNGESSTLSDVNWKMEVDKEGFKVPTPKAPPVEEKDIEDTENFAVRKKPRISTTKPVLSPASPASSPENLIIDCQNSCLSPRTLQNRTNSPQCNIEVLSNDDGKWTNNATFKPTKAHTPSPKQKQSPIPSPIVLHHSNPSPVSNGSPAEIDDDLMNEAIMGYGS